MAFLSTLEMGPVAGVPPPGLPFFQQPRECGYVAQSLWSRRYGTDHRLADPEPLEALARAVEVR
jgi:hypothetical protein